MCGGQFIFLVRFFILIVWWIWFSFYIRKNTFGLREDHSEQLAPRKWIATSYLFKWPECYYCQPLVRFHLEAIFEHREGSTRVLLSTPLTELRPVWVIWFDEEEVSLALAMHGQYCTQKVIDWCVQFECKEDERSKSACFNYFADGSFGNVKVKSEPLLPLVLPHNHLTREQ